MHSKQTFEELVANFSNPERDTWQKPDAVIASLGDIAGKTIADIGAGSGYFTFKLANKGAKVIAVDIDKRFIDYLNKRVAAMNPKFKDLISTRYAEASDPYLKANEVDIILIVNTYHHIEDRVAYMQGLQKTLRPNGEIVIIDYKYDTSAGPPRKYKLAAEKVATELKEAGYTTINIDYKLLEHQYVIKAY